MQKEENAVLLKLDMASKVPIYMQIRNQIVLGIASGELAPGEKLPTIRALAEQSGVNMMTVNKAYGLLKQEGYITTDRRGGTVVSGSPGAGALSERYVAALRVIAAEARLTAWTRTSLPRCAGTFSAKEGAEAMLKMIFFLLVWSVVPLLAGMMCNEAKPKKGIILGATLP